MIAARNDDAHERSGVGHVEAHPVGVGQGAVQHLARPTAALKMPLEGEGARRVGVGLLVPTAGRRTLVLAPVIEHARHVLNVARNVEGLEREVVVLGARHVRTGALGEAQDAPAHHEEVRDVVVAVQAREAGRRLERGRSVDAVAQVILVAIEQVALRIPGDGLGEAPERVRLEHVVMVEERHVLPHRRRDTGVRVLGDGGVLNLKHAHAWIGNLREHAVDARIRPARVHEYELPGGIGLREHRVDAGTQVRGRRAENGHDDAHERTGVRRRPLTLSGKQLGRGAVLLEPDGVVAVGGTALGEHAEVTPQPGERALADRGEVAAPLMPRKSRLDDQVPHACRCRQGEHDHALRERGIDLRGDHVVLQNTPGKLYRLQSPAVAKLDVQLCRGIVRWEATGDAQNASVGAVGPDLEELHMGAQGRELSVDAAQERGEHGLAHGEQARLQAGELRVEDRANQARAIVRRDERHILARLEQRHRHDDDSSARTASGFANDGGAAVELEH